MDQAAFESCARMFVRAIEAAACEKEGAFEGRGRGTCVSLSCRPRYAHELYTGFLVGAPGAPVLGRWKGMKDISRYWIARRNIALTKESGLSLPA